MPSLFPFLSVLLCAMGVLIVVISAQNLIVVGGDLDQVLEIGAGDYDERKAIYVECRETGIVIYPLGTEVAFDAIESQEESSQWRTLLTQVEARRESEYFVFLIRPGGIKTYDECFEQVYMLNQTLKERLDLEDDQLIQVGKDALLEGGELILTNEGKPVLPSSAAEGAN